MTENLNTADNLRDRHFALMKAAWENPALAATLDAEFTHPEHLYINAYVMYLLDSNRAGLTTAEEVQDVLAGIFGTDAGRAYYRTAQHHMGVHHYAFWDIAEKAYVQANPTD